MYEFQLVTVADVTCAVQALLDKQCSSDSVWMHVPKSSIGMLAPFLVKLFNQSLLHVLVLTAFKAAYITPLLKKPDLDPADVQSYRLISNLSVLSKLHERLVASQLVDYLSASMLLPDLQSAYRVHHSMETAVVKILADILKTRDGGDLTMLTLTMLTLLDLSTTFDTVDYAILLRHLESSYGLHGCVLHDLRRTSTVERTLSVVEHSSQFQQWSCA